MMDLTSIINILVLAFPFLGAYIIYVIQKKAKILEDIIVRLYRLEKRQAVIEYIEDEHKK